MLLSMLHHANLELVRYVMANANDMQGSYGLTSSVINKAWM